VEKPKKYWSSITPDKEWYSVDEMDTYLSHKEKVLIVCKEANKVFAMQVDNQNKEIERLRGCLKALVSRATYSEKSMSCFTEAEQALKGE
jgi:hypothetical protein